MLRLPPPDERPAAVASLPDRERLRMLLQAYSRYAALLAEQLAALDRGDYAALQALAVERERVWEGLATGDDERGHALAGLLAGGRTAPHGLSRDARFSGGDEEPILEGVTPAAPPSAVDVLLQEALEVLDAHRPPTDASTAVALELGAAARLGHALTSHGLATRLPEWGHYLDGGGTPAPGTLDVRR